jgi:hypothetical protein
MLLGLFGNSLGMCKLPATPLAPRPRGGVGRGRWGAANYIRRM